jgi:hypothetical protein
MSGSDPRKAPFDPAMCPLCDLDNDCARALGTMRGQACWCQTLRIPATLVARVPHQQRGLACICQRCVMAHGEREWPNLDAILKSRLDRVRRDR